MGSPTRSILDLRMTLRDFYKKSAVTSEAGLMASREREKVLNEALPDYEFRVRELGRGETRVEARKRAKR